MGIHFSRYFKLLYRDIPHLASSSMKRPKRFVKRLYRELPFLVLILLFTIPSSAQDYYFKKYKVENGLSHNTVLSSLQDRHGFLWFGTKDGLNRFDGYTFRRFQNDPLADNGLRGNYIECLHEFDKMLWAGTDNGLFSYDERSENFEILKGTQRKSIFDIEHDANGNLWYIAEGGLYRHNLAQQKTVSYPRDDFFDAVTIARSPEDVLWVASTNALYRYSPSDDSFEHFDIDIAEDMRHPLRINTLFFLNGSTLLLGTQNHGIIAFDLDQGRIKNLSPLTDTSHYVRDMALRVNDELWVATETGIYIYNLTKDEQIHLKKNYDDPYALSDNAVYTLTVDREGGIWAGTYFGGINFLAYPYYPFKKFFPMASRNSISGNAVREIKPDTYGNIWIGTEDAGLNKYNPKTGRFTEFTSKERGGILSHHNVHGLLPIKDKLYIGMFDNGLDVLDIPTNTITAHYSAGGEEGLGSNFVFHLFESEKGEIFVITTSGIQIYDPETARFEFVDYFPRHIFYTCFVEAKDGTLWAGSYSEGLYFYDPKTGKTGSYQYDEDTPHSISHNHINAIFQDANQKIWITTENGLNLFNPDKGHFKKFTTNDNFPSNVFYTILEDDTGILWITTSNGLVEFDPETHEMKTYTEGNGLLSNQFNYASAYKDGDGKLYFGSVNGLIRFDPADFTKNTYHAPIFFTGLQINGKEIKVDTEESPLEQSITMTEKLVLAPRQSSFAIDFAALSFTAPKKTGYRYRLEGLNEDWINLDKTNRISFTELPAGDYTLQIEARNDNREWSPEAASLQIEVLPVFWKSPLAYSLYAILACLIVFTGFRMYHQRIKANNRQRLKQLNHRKEKEIYQAKIEFFTNVAHEVRTPLTLIIGPLEKMMQSMDEIPRFKDTLQVMEKNTSRLLNLVNQLLDFRKTELEDIRLTFLETNITDLVKQTQTRFSQAIETAQIDFEMHLENQEIYAYVDGEALRKITSNLFNNAIKYAENKVSVYLKATEDSFELTVNNDGPLIPSHLKTKIFEPFYRVPGIENQSRTGTGIGLSLAASLTELHNGSLQLNTASGVYNSFVLHLPIHQENKFVLHPSEELQSERTDDYALKELEYNKDRPTLLCVEDNVDLLDFVSKDLMTDYTILKATSAEQALTIIENENIQLIISDIMLPAMDGFSFCEKIKTDLETSHIPVLLLTAKSALKAKIAGLESGADAYIEKPFTMEYLRVQIANLLENRKNIIEHYSSSPLAHIRSIAHTKTDETFIKKLDEVIESNISDPHLNVEVLAEIMNMSRSTLYRKIKEMSDLSPNELVSIAKLKKAAELLRTGDYKVYEIAEMVGYNSQTSFGRNFQKQFDMTPTEYMKGVQV
ncbi:MAG TPA: two-component regulator propeller domain-containing protein [Pricia sp.]|nr:two-component regulator propeller domain-containing protein [Pricia sp.]